VMARASPVQIAEQANNPRSSMLYVLGGETVGEQVLLVGNC
jgi:hypothetical protein